jgi:hypothetical protein
MDFSSHHNPDDRYAEGTKRIKRYLGDKAVDVLGVQAWRERFAEEPDTAKTEKDVRIGVFPQCAHIIAAHPEQAVSIPKTVLDHLEEVITRRTAENRYYRLFANCSSELWKKFRSHKAFVNMLKEIQDIFWAADKRHRSDSLLPAPVATEKVHFSNRFSTLSVQHTDDPDDLNAMTETIESSSPAMAGTSSMLDAPQSAADLRFVTNTIQLLANLEELRTLSRDIWKEHKAGKTGLMVAALTTDRIAQSMKQEVDRFLLINDDHRYLQATGEYPRAALLSYLYTVFKSFEDQLSDATERTPSKSLLVSKDCFFMPPIETWLYHCQNKNDKEYVSFLSALTLVPEYGKPISLENGDHFELDDKKDTDELRYICEWERLTGPSIIKASLNRASQTRTPE